MDNSTGVPMLFMQTPKPSVSYSTSSLQNLLNDLQPITDDTKPTSATTLHISTDFENVPKVNTDVQDVCLDIPNILFKTFPDRTDKMADLSSRASLSDIFDRNAELTLPNEEDIVLTQVEDPQNIFLDRYPSTFSLSSFTYNTEDSSKSLIKTELPSEFKVLAKSTSTSIISNMPVATGILSFLNLYHPTKLIRSTPTLVSACSADNPNTKPAVIENLNATETLVEKNKKGNGTEPNVPKKESGDIVKLNSENKGNDVTCEGEKVQFELEENWKNMFCEVFDNYNGYVKDLKTAEELVEEYASDTDSKFCVWNSPKNFGATEISSKTPRKILINPKNYPYIVLCMKRMDCEYGRDRHKHDKLQKLEKSPGYKDGKCPSKKTNCGAVINLREVVVFPELKIKRGTHWERRLVSTKIRSWLVEQSPSENMKLDRYIHISLPKMQDHTNHFDQGFKESIHPKILQEAYQLVWENENVYVEDLRDKLYRYVEKTFFSHQRPELKRRRFFPALSDLRYIITKAKKIRIVSDDEKRKTKALVNELCSEKLFDKFYICDDIVCVPEKDATSIKTSMGRYYLRVKNRPSKLIFMYQSSQSQALLFRYGIQSVFCLLSQSLVSVPFEIYCLYVCTNVDFQPVAIMICENANEQIFTDILERLKDWNKFWNPKFVQTDKNQDQINAFEAIFTDCSVFITPSSRETDWMGALQDFGMEDKVEEMLKILNAISSTCTEEGFNEALRELEEKEEWKNSVKFQIWFTENWLSHTKRWVEGYYPNEFINKCLHTGNSQEFFQPFKTSAVKRSHAFLVDLIKRMVGVFQHSYQRYVEYNVSCFHSDVADSLHSQLLTSQVLKYLQNIRKEAESFNGTIGFIEFGLYQVKDVDTEVYNVVTLGDAVNFPSCNCSQWQQYRLPCKHMFFVFIHVDEWSFNRLPVHYRTNPLFTLDFNCLQDGAKRQTHRKEVGTQTKKCIKTKTPCSATITTTNVLCSSQTTAGSSHDVNKRKRKHETDGDECSEEKREE